MEYQIFRPTDHHPRSDVAIEDLNEPYWRSEIVPPSPELVAHEAKFAQEREYLAMQDEATAEDLARHEAYTGRRSVGRIGMMAYHLHPEVTTLQNAAEVQRSYETREGTTLDFMANVAIESVTAHWEQSRRTGAISKLAAFAARTREVLIPTYASVMPERAVGAAQVPNTSSRFSSEDLAFLTGLRHRYLDADTEFGRTQLA